jgi:uncharacterized protein (TIGR02145 family)
MSNRTSKIWFLIPAVVLAVEFAWSCKKNAAVTPPTLTSTDVSAITESTATSGGEITSDGGAAITARGVCWSTAADPTISNSKSSNGIGTGIFTSAITGLNPGTTYHLRAYATNSAGTGYGDDLSFTTNTVLASLTTAAVTAINEASATSGGTISTDGGAVITQRGVCWSTSANPTISDNKTINGADKGTFTSSITGLTPGTTYHVRAYATNSAGTSYGNDVFFTTHAFYPILTTTAISSPTATSASGGGNISSDGGATVTARGVCWSIAHYPMTADAKSTDGTGTGSFTSNLTGLISGTTYYVRAYATNSIGTAYGNEVSFMTLETMGTVTDADNNIYQTLSIGTQMWMKENLKTTKLNDGTLIPLVTDNTWSTLTTPAFGWYNNDVATYKEIYGGYYNFYTVSTGKLCPAGWRVPSDADWMALFSFLGGTSIAGGKLKETGTTHWLGPNTGATNESGFTGLPGGYRFPGDGSYGGITQLANWWTATQQDPNMGFHKQLQWDTSVIGQAGGVKTWGRNVRCVK